MRKRTTLLIITLLLLLFGCGQPTVTNTGSNQNIVIQNAPSSDSGATVQDNAATDAGGVGQTISSPDSLYAILDTTYSQFVSEGGLIFFEAGGINGQYA